MSTINKTYRWLAIYTRSKFEKKIAAALSEKGIDHYLPLKVEKRKWSDRIKKIEEPLLKGYLFVRVSNKEYFNVLNTPGAVCYITFDGKATPIPDKQINDLKIFMDTINEKIDITQENLEKGKKVIVVSGPLKGVTGELVEFRGKKRIALRFEKLGYCIMTDIPQKDIEVYHPELIPRHRRLTNSLAAI